MLKINEIFYSLQGEGVYTGYPAIFVRLANCNLKCKFCDTDFTERIELKEEDIIKEIEKYPCKLVVLTGGEPLMQDLELLLNLLYEEDYDIHLETNGTFELPIYYKSFSWVTCSPKVYPLLIEDWQVDEWKLIVDRDEDEKKLIEIISQLDYGKIFIQPCWDKDPILREANLQKAIELVKKHNLRLSLQSHKLIGIK